MKILIIEDEKSLCEILQQWLEKERYVVETSTNFATASEKVSIYKYDCVLLDVMLPDGNGLELLKKIKAEKLQENIIIISAKDSLDDKVLGLNTGADDYLPKPFHLPELSARIRSVTRRNGSGQNYIIFGNIKLQPDDFQVFVDDKPIELNRKEFDMLHFFINRPNRLLNREIIAEAVWGDNIDQADSFDFIYSQIKNLRKKMQQAEANCSIKAVYGIGYKLVEN
ncbi:MAG: response regulator transcription factor [Bacteroidales bacterium]|jgi:DNA-binding response OmpR family regulator|nr:response regulator transcription factor [Bacteroidales bacterium]